jgi:penicillin-binding protein 1B
MLGSAVRTIDERLQGERLRTLPRIYGRPLELRAGLSLTPPQLIDRLNDLGYAHRPRLDKPGQFAVGAEAVALMPRDGPAKGRIVRVVFGKPPAARRGAPAAPPRVLRIEIEGKTSPSTVLEAPLLSAIVTSNREKRRPVALDLIPRHVREAVLAIEDRRFYGHPGVDVIRSLGALVTNVRGDRPYLVGGSTLTQQLVKNFFLTPAKTLRRKIQEQFMALVLERRATKDEILELYLNDVYLGQRGSFAVHGVAEAARLFFGKNVSNLSVAEAATIAGVIQAPQVYSPFRSPERARERRDVVLRAMTEAGFLSSDAAARAVREPLAVVSTAFENQAPYFLDYVTQMLVEQQPQALSSSQPVEIYTTLDVHLQRLAQESVREGLARLDQTLSRRRRPAQAQAALIAIDPRTGEILAMVGGRSYNQSQFNRAVHARRQPGSVFKPFVYLAAFELAAAEGRVDLTPATLVEDEPTTFWTGQEEWAPANYGDEYDGLTTFRGALARSRNIATIKAAEAAGYENIAALWRKIGPGEPPHPYPSIALGVFEATPLEIASAYMTLANLGVRRPAIVMSRATVGGAAVELPAPPKPEQVAHPDCTYLVVDMLQSVLSEGTGAGARAAGFALDAAGKSGTTNDLRDAWFAGFTPELLTVVWVGLDDNQALGLSGSQAALPIWTSFMQRALAGRPNIPFEAPEGVVFVDIDRDTGGLAAPGCPRVIREVFLTGAEPVARCALHSY